jgi:bifunctional UDP-N-acetylglucosamine pyrophosphorylase/glucosamine-1-phosphate N-acetyltransferase
VLVLYADTPLVEPTTLRRLRDELAKGADLAVLGFRPKAPLATGG